MTEQRPFEVDDEVYLIERNRMYRTKIVRVTKTLAVIESGVRYKQSNGNMVGASVWDIHRIVRPSPVSDRQWDVQRMRDVEGQLSAAALRGIPAGIRSWYEAWDKLEKEVNGE